MAISNIISAIGNNSGIYPLLVRDCCIEAPSKIIVARRENLKESREIANDATRERFIDEYATSAIWLGGIPATEYITDKFIAKKGYNAGVSIKLFNGTEFQSIEKNIEKFKNIQQQDVQKAVQDLIKTQNNRGVYEKLLTKKFFIATAIPTIIMGFVLPKLNFALTRKIRKSKEEAKQNITANYTFKGNKNFSQVTFTGNFASSVANLITVDKMAISDGGLTVGRVSTSRNKDEAYVNAFRMIGSMILNFVTPKYIAKFLDNSANKIFKINVNLDPIIFDNIEFLNAVQNKTLELPKSVKESDILEFLDNNPNSLFSKFAQKLKKVTYLQSGYRDPRKFVDTQDLAKLKTEIERFIELSATTKNTKKFIEKAKYIKYGNILANVGISSFLLAFALPKAQYLFNKLITGSYTDPGLRK